MTTPSSTGLTLRPYQIECIEKIRREIRAGRRAVILQMATGGGKTAVSASIMQSATSKGKKCLFIAAGRELINQTESLLVRMGLDRGIIMAGRGYNYQAPIQVASLDTLYSRSIKRKVLSLPPADVVVFDECHGCAAPSARTLFDSYPNAVRLGLSATPCRLDGKGLDFYQAIVVAIPSRQLIRDGYLVPYKIYAPYRPNLKGFKGAGDFSESFREERMNKPKITGDIVSHWRRLASGRPTVVFASSIAHSINIRDAFAAAGIRAIHVDGETPTDIRDGAIRALDSGEAQVICNYGVMVQGVDIPRISCIILARPTKSLVVYRQAIGRGMRPSPETGKVDLLILDHAGCVFIHGMPDVEIDWSLDGTKKMEPIAEPGKPPEEATPSVCPKCSAVFQKSPVCPECGYRIVAKVKKAEIEKEAGLLVQLTDAEKTARAFEKMQRTWLKYLGVAAARGATIGAAANMFVRDFGMPPWEVGGIGPIPPNRSDFQLRVTTLYPKFARRKP